MEGLLFVVIQLIIQALLGTAKLLCMIAMLIGRLLAMLLPVFFRAVTALVMGLVRLFAAVLRSKSGERVAARPREYRPRQAVPPARSRGNKPASKPLTYRRRYTVENFWRSGDG